MFQIFYNFPCNHAILELSFILAMMSGILTRSLARWTPSYTSEAGTGVSRYMVSGISLHWCTWSSITCVLLDWGWPLPPQWPCSVGVAVPEPELPTLSSLIILDSLVTFLLGPCPPSTLSLSLTPCFLPPSLPLCSLLSAAVPGLLLIFYWLGDIAED